MDMTSDSDLIVKLRDDDSGAFDAIYWRYHQAIFRNILKLTKDPEAARDILQDVFSILWEKRMDIDSQRSVSGWLFVISFNQSVNYLRKKLRESSAEDSIIALTEMSDNDGSALLEDQYQLLGSAILQLSSQKRRVFTLCKMEGKSYEAAAQEMNISKHTVKEYLSLAVASVKGFIKGSKAYTF